MTSRKTSPYRGLLMRTLVHIRGNLQDLGNEEGVKVFLQMGILLLTKYRYTGEIEYLFACSYLIPLVAYLTLATLGKVLR